MVLAVSSGALFDVNDEEAVFRNDGVSGHRAHQRSREQQPLRPGTAFPLVRRLLALNDCVDAGDAPVQVVLLSRQDPDAGLRVLNSIEAHRLPIARAIFTSGRDPLRFARALGASLFLSSHVADVRTAIAAGVPAGRVCPSGFHDDHNDAELRIAFDFDGVLADDTSEQVYQSQGLEAFHDRERAHALEPIGAGPLARFCGHLSALQRLVTAAWPGMPPPIRIAIVTSRGAPAHARVVTTLRSRGIAVDEAFFLGGLPKAPVLVELKPHIYFDDQWQHISDAHASAPCAHVPFGVANGHSSVPACDARLH